MLSVWMYLLHLAASPCVIKDHVAFKILSWGILISRACKLPEEHQCLPASWLLTIRTSNKSSMFLTEYVMGPKKKSTGLTQCNFKPFFRGKYLTLCKTLYFSDLSWLSYKLLFLRQDPSSITPGGKPSHGRSCHLEADLFSRLIDSTPSPCLPPSSFSLSLFLYLPSYHCFAVCSDQTGSASLPDFQSVLGTGPLNACLTVFKGSTAGGRRWRDVNWEHSPFRCKSD